MATANQISYDASFDQGTWQQPAGTENLDQQDIVYYTGIISAAPQSYYTGNPPTNTLPNNFATQTQGTKAGVAKPPKVMLGGGNQTKSGCAQYVGNMLQSGAPNEVQYQEVQNHEQYQINATGQFMSYNTNAVEYYGYSNDQCITNSEDMITNSESYNTMGQAMGVKHFNISNVGMSGNNNGCSGASNPNQKKGMNFQNGNTDRMIGIGGVSYHESVQINNNRQMGQGTPYKVKGMSYNNNKLSVYQSNLGVAGNVESKPEGSLPSNFDSVDSYNNDFNYGCGSSGSHYRNSRGRGHLFKNHSRGSYRGQFNIAQGNWRQAQDNRNNNYYVDNHIASRGEFYNPHHHLNTYNDQSTEYHHPCHSKSESREAEGNILIQLSPTHYNHWCRLRKRLGKKDNELAEYLLDIHEKCCYEKNGTKTLERKRKATKEPEEEEWDKFTEEEIQMKELMGFTGFKSTKGSKPKSVGFTTFGIIKTEYSRDTEEHKSAASTSLTPEERKAMASLGGFAVFTKSDNVQPAAVGFGAPAITFTADSDT